MIRKLLLLAVFVSSLAHTEDIRLQPVKDLKGYFPFKPPSSLAVCGMPYCKGLPAVHQEAPHGAYSFA
jgi:hypothetical protein